MELNNLCYIITSGDILCDVTESKENANDINQYRKLQIIDKYELTGILKVDGTVL